MTTECHTPKISHKSGMPSSTKQSTHTAAAGSKRLARLPAQSYQAVGYTAVMRSRRIWLEGTEALVYCCPFFFAHLDTSNPSAYEHVARAAYISTRDAPLPFTPSVRVRAHVSRAFKTSPARGRKPCCVAALFSAHQASSNTHSPTRAKNS